MTNPTTVVINRPRAPTVRLRHKGNPTMMEDGSVCQKFSDESNRTFWLVIQPIMLQHMMNTYEESKKISSPLTSGV